MLALIGRGYVTAHCLACFNRQAEDRAFRVYITDALKAISENTGRMVRDGKAMRDRYIDLMENRQTKPEDEEDADKKAKGIIFNIRAKIKKMRGKEDG